MKIQELLVEIEKDSIVDNHQLGQESTRIPALHSKYLTLRANEKLLLKQLNMQYAILHKERWTFYSGKSSPQAYKDENFDLKVLRGDIDIYIDSDVKLQELKSKISVQETKVETIDDFLKALIQRHWMISNSIKWSQMLNGGIQ